MYIFLRCACLSLSQFVIYTIVKCVLLQCSQIMKLFLYILLWNPFPYQVQKTFSIVLGITFWVLNFKVLFLP